MSRALQLVGCRCSSLLPQEGCGGMRKGKEPRCWGKSLVPSPAYSGILMKRRVSSSLIYHIM